MRVTSPASACWQTAANTSCKMGRLCEEGEMKRIWVPLFLVALSTVMTSGLAWAQATAQVSGTVRDPSGAVLPGVEVTATQTDTGISRSAVTNETGSYILPNL